MKVNVISAEFSNRLKFTPHQPGVYFFRNAAGSIIYVGKASNLQNRLRYYFQSVSRKEPKTRKMINRIADFEFVVTESEGEALILENLLIKRYKPFYNIRLKDDKTYPYIKIDLMEAFPQLYFTRRVLADGARYFGPFASARAVRKTMDLLKKLFPYRSCTKAITGKDERPCLEYYINRCIAPCTGAASQQEYREVIDQAILFLEGNTDPILRSLRSDMKQAAGSMNFERAAIIRDQLKALESISDTQKIASANDENADIIALAFDQGEAWVEIFNLRHGKVIGRNHFLMENAKDDPGKVVQESFLQQFYQESISIPPLLLVQEKMDNSILIQEWLTQKRGKHVSIHVPDRGTKKKLVEWVAENAKQGLLQKQIKWLADTNKVNQALIELTDALGLTELPKRIECYDISNIQGTHPVGSMIVFENGKPKPQNYRRYQIKTVDGPDDYSSMQEMLRRRFKRMSDSIMQKLLSEAGPQLSSGGHGTETELDTSSSNEMGKPVPSASNLQTQDSDATQWGLVPDLVLIDGGKGHLSAIQQVFLELGIKDIPLASIAKQQEEIFLPNQPEPVRLPRSSQGLYLVQRIRDEAHRFAITYHRNKRSKSFKRSILDSIPGIGPKRRRTLLQQFGSVDRLRSVPVEQIASVPGMNLSLAQKTKDIIGG